MMRSWFWCALALVAAVGQQTGAQEQGADAGTSVRAAAAAEEPESIFNGQVRRYSFALEGTAVTAETAEEFVVQYQGRDRPRILGAYADGEHNALVVVAGPEAEQAIRENLAEWLVARKAFGSPSLKAQRRALEERWRTALFGMAECEVKLVEVTGDRSQQLRDRLRLFEAELAMFEKQLQVLDRFISRLEAGPSAGQ
jgi:hypothetical protein